MLIDGDDEIIEELKQIWDDDYKKTTLEMKKTIVNIWRTLNILSGVLYMMK